MTKTEIREDIKTIWNAVEADDYEVAHHLEDNLRDRVLRHIADGCENAAELAEEVLYTTKIGFPRFCS